MNAVFAHLGGGDEGGLGRIWQLLGAFHPLVVHFPIGLLLTAALVELATVWKKDSAGLRYAVTTNLVLGTLGAVVAAPLGWIDATQMHFEPDLKAILFWHRWLGTSTAVVSIIVSALWFSWARSGSTLGLAIYRVTLWAMALTLAVTGHFGGLLVYGADYFSPS